MEEKIIQSGFKCKNNVKAEIVRYLWKETEYREQILERIKAMSEAFHSIPEELRGQIPLKPGFRVAGVMVLDEVMMAKIFDVLQEDGLIEQWEKTADDMTRLRLLRCMQVKQEDFQIDCTGFLIHAIVKNPRCVQELRSYMEHHGEECYQAYQKSKYSNMPLFGWFSDREALDARLCLGLLEQVRQSEDKSEAYQAFLSIANSGYKRMRNRIKQSREGINGREFCMLSDDPISVLRLSVCMLGLVLAQDMGVPIHVDCDFYMVIDIIENGSREMLEKKAEQDINEEGKSRSREFMERYYCEDFYKSCCERVRKGKREPGERLKILLEEQDDDVSADDWDREPASFRAVFSMFDLNPRMLQEIRLTEKEVQQLCSISPDIEWEDYKVLLLLASVCKYIKAQKMQPGTEKLFIQRMEQRRQLKAANAQREVFQDQMLKLQRQVNLICRERDDLADRLEETRQQLQRRREQLQDIRSELEQRRQELEELRNYVCQLVGGEEENENEEPEKHTGIHEGDKASDGAGNSICKNYLNHRKVVVIGGHENWQRRFREYFPGWQFLSSSKNNYDAGCVRNKEIIIVNTAVLKHSCYYRIMSERSREQMVLYVHGSNPERCLEELEQQLKARR